MHFDHSTIHLSRGCQRLTVMKLAGRFVGLIDGYLYTIADSPDIVVRHLLLASAGRRSPWSEAMTKKHAKGDSAGLVGAGKRAAGDAEEDATPLRAEEKAIMDEVRREAGRPNKQDIRDEAKKLLKPGR